MLIHAFPMALAAAQAQAPLELTCYGEGSANTASVATVNSNSQTYGRVGNTPVIGNTTGSSTVIIPGRDEFQDQVGVRLFSGDDRIKMPRSMLPVIHGGKAGWFKFKNVVADARFIKGKAAMGLFSNPDVVIDRVTGSISIAGNAGSFSGQCEAVQTDGPAKF